MKKLLILICIFNYVPAFAQNQLGLKNLWLLGYTWSQINVYDKPHIDYISGYDSVYLAQRLNGQDGTDASMNDSAGNLLFYTNGIAVFNSNLVFMLNGQGLNPSSYVTGHPDGLPMKQAAIIIPKPGNDSLFYLFHETGYYTSLGSMPFELYLTILNMKGDNNLGEVILKNFKVIANDTLNRGMTACKHANGRDWWIIAKDFANDNFYKLLVTPDTIIKYSQQIGSIRLGASGASCFSPDGSRYVITDFLDQTDLFDFDRCTGLFSNWRYIPQIDSLYPIGAAFSPSSRYLYLAGGYRMVQFDCTVPNIISTIDTVAYYDGYFAVYPVFKTDFNRAHIAPDNKIYVNSGSSVLSLHVIDQPDSGGAACNVLQHAITLPSWNAGALVNHPNYFLGPVVGSVCDSLSLAIDDKVYDKNMLLTVAPNPAKNSFYLNYNLPTGKNATLYVYSTLGNLIHKQWLYGVNNSLAIHCNTWPQGMYYLKVVMDKSERCSYAKVVVSR